MALSGKDSRGVPARWYKSAQKSLGNRVEPSLKTDLGIHVIFGHFILMQDVKCKSQNDNVKLTP